MLKIHKQILEDVMEGLNFNSIDTDLILKALSQFDYNKMIDSDLEEPIIAAIKQDQPEWEFDLIDTIHLIHIKYWEFGELITSWRV